MICIVVFGCNVIVIIFVFVLGIVVGVIELYDFVSVFVVGILGVGKSFKIELFVSEVIGLVLVY